MAREYFCCYHSYRAKLAKLSDQEVGRLFRALMEYSELGERPELAGRESVAFDFIADDIDRAKDKYADTCAKNRANASERQRSVATASERKRPQANASETVQYKDKDKDENKDYVETTNVVCAEQASPPASVPPMPMNDGTEYRVTEAQLAQWLALYPAVDVEQALRNMAGWLIGNPKNRKTRTGMPRFITGWLAREQNRARPEAGTAPRSQASTSKAAAGRRNVDALFEDDVFEDKKGVTYFDITGNETGV